MSSTTSPATARWPPRASYTLLRKNIYCPLAMACLHCPSPWEPHPGKAERQEHEELGLKELLPEGDHDLPPHYGEGMGLLGSGGPDGLGQESRMVDGVGIGEEEELSPGLPGSLVTGPWLPEPPLRERLSLDEVDSAGVAGWEPSDDLRRPIPAPVVHHDDLENRVRRAAREVTQASMFSSSSRAGTMTETMGQSSSLRQYRLILREKRHPLPPGVPSARSRRLPRSRRWATAGSGEAERRGPRRAPWPSREGREESVPWSTSPGVALARETKLRRGGPRERHIPFQPNLLTHPWRQGGVGTYRWFRGSWPPGQRPRAATRPENQPRGSTR
jgi:hypothetical protein